MRLEEIGERGAVEVLKRIFDRGYEIGIGDDCGVVDLGEHYLLITTDVISQRTHLPPSATPSQIGWYLVAANLSDVAAMGGYPLGFVGGLGLPRKMEMNWLRGLAQGMEDCAKQHGIAILGGDTKETEHVTLSGTAIGKVRKDRILLRRGAKKGDALVITGELGRGGLGARHVRDGTDVVRATDMMMRPFPRVEEGKLLAEFGGVTSCMDISDGLGTTLAQMSQQSETGFRVEWEKLPVHKDVRALPKDDALSLALYWGGDFELAATVSQDRVEDLVRTFRSKRHPIAVCGRVTASGPNDLMVGGKKETLYPHGWEHFRTMVTR